MLKKIHSLLTAHAVGSLSAIALAGLWWGASEGISRLRDEGAELRAKVAALEAQLRSNVLESPPEAPRPDHPSSQASAPSWRMLPNSQTIEGGSYILSIDLLCPPCTQVPEHIDSLMRDAGARPVVRHMLRSPQAIAFALLYESILFSVPDKALPFLRWALNESMESRRQPGFGQSWLLSNLTQEEQLTVASLVSDSRIQSALNSDTAWFLETGIFETPMLFIDGRPFNPVPSTTLTYGRQAKLAAEGLK